MHLAFISNLYPPHVLGGYEILCEQVCHLLEARGHRVTILTSDHSNPGIPFSRHEGNVYRDLHLFRPFNEVAQADRWAKLTTTAHNRRIARAFLDREKPDLVFVWSQLRSTVGPARAAQEAGYPIVFTFNDEHPAGFLPVPFQLHHRRIITWILERTFLRPATWLGLPITWSTCISRMLKDNLVRAGLPIQDSRVIYQGIPIARFPRREALFPVPVGIPKILYAGQLHEYKGVHTLIEAAHKLAARGSFTRVEIAIAGDGTPEYRARLERLAKERAANVEFLGRRPHQELPQLYRSHDVFVFPSIWQEPFGLTHLEAMASGTPVISTADGGHGEFLADGDNALVFPKNDAEALADCLYRLLTEPGLAVKLADNARKMVEERFTLDRYVTDLEHLLEEAVKDHRR